MTKREQKIFYAIQDLVLTECSIQCQKCKNIKSGYNTEDWRFTEKLIDIGWTFENNKVLCENCK